LPLVALAPCGAFAPRCACALRRALHEGRTYGRLRRPLPIAGFSPFRAFRAFRGCISLPRFPSFTMSEIIVLDFDGVICDSAPENAATAWRCCCRLWPEQFSGAVPREQIERFCKELRPYMETGYQSIIQTKLLWSGAPIASITREFSSRLEELLASIGETKSSLKALFGGERDRWLSEDMGGWLDHNSFYPGAAEALCELLSRGRVVILTTKECRFVERLMERAGVDFPKEEIFGLERIKNKETTLSEMLQCGTMAFVEDRLATLERVEAVPALEGVKLVYATWGYSTPEQRAAAKANPRIFCIDNPLALKEIP